MRMWFFAFRRHVALPVGTDVAVASCFETSVFLYAAKTKQTKTCTDLPLKT